MTEKKSNNAATVSTKENQSTNKAQEKTVDTTEKTEGMEERAEALKLEDKTWQSDQEKSKEDQETKKPSSKVSVKYSNKNKRKPRRRQVFKGKVFIKSTYNNTIVNFTDLHGGSLAWSSAGLLGFKGAKKATTYAASQVAADAIEKVQRYGLKDVEVYVKGVGSGREAAVRMLAQKGLNLVLIKDRTPIPHNGCRPKKLRRV